jgi:hypothetical protein
MDVPEATLFMAKVKNYYSRYYFDHDDDDLLMAAETWSEALPELSLDHAIMLLKRHASKSKYPPTVAEIREEMSIVKEDTLTDGEAWAMAKRIVKKNYWGPGVKVDNVNYLGASEEVIKAVKAIGMEQIFMSETEGVERSNFLRIYNQLKDRSVKEKMIPQHLQIGTIRNEFLLEGDQERKVLKLERAREIQKQDNIKIKENKNKKTDFKGLLDCVKSMKQIISSMGNTAK